MIGVVSLVHHFGSGERVFAYLSNLEGRIGYVDIDRAVRSHPLWPELEAIEQEIAATQAQWNAYLKKSLYYADADALIRLLSELETGQAEALKARVETEIARETEKRQAELEKREQEILAAAEAKIKEAEEDAKKRFQNELDELAKGLEKEMNTEADRVRKKYQKDMLNIQVELALAKLSDASRKAKLEELARLQSELDQQLEAISSKYNRELEKKQAQLEKQFQAELTEAVDAIEEEARAEAERLRLQLSQEISEFAAAKELALQQMMEQREQLNFTSQDLFLAGRDPNDLGVPADAVAMQAQIVDELERQRDALREVIMEDIKAAAIRVAEEHGMEAVLEQDKVSLGGVDVTKLIVEQLPS